MTGKDEQRLAKTSRLGDSHKRVATGISLELNQTWSGEAQVTLTQ
jgi:hypothetical protein